MSALRKAGDFPDKSVVEYATIKVEIPHRLVPINLRNEHYEDEDLVQGLSVSPTGRLSYKTLYLYSKELAEKLAERLADLFKNRPYREHYHTSGLMRRMPGPHPLASSRRRKPTGVAFSVGRHLTDVPL